MPHLCEVIGNIQLHVNSPANQKLHLQNQLALKLLSPKQLALKPEAVGISTVVIDRCVCVILKKLMVRNKP